MEKQIKYLQQMTDDFGIIQFSNNSVPDINSGYTLDDVSRALIVSSNLGLESLTNVYLNFIKNAQNKDGSFVNVFNSSKNPLEKTGSQDSFARTLWALGEYFNTTGDLEEIISKSINYLEKNPMQYPISESFAVLGLSKLYGAGFEKSKTKTIMDRIRNSLTAKIEKHSDKKWFWPSNELTYENARIPQAFFRILQNSGDIEDLRNAENLTEFLDSNVFREKGGKIKLNLIGNGVKNANTPEESCSWYQKGGAKPLFDEQPVDAGAITELHAEAHKIINNNHYHLDRAEKSLEWFYGKNRLNKNMLSPEGGIYDGLRKKDINPNQGAESLLAYMMAKIKFDRIKEKNGI